MNDKQPPDFEETLPEQPEPPAQQGEELQEALAKEINARQEERFFFVVVVILLLNVVFFSVLDGWGGPIALVVVELLILVPLAHRMGIEEITELLDRVLGRVASSMTNKREKDKERARA